MTAKTLYPFQKQATNKLLEGKHIIISGTGSGKGTMAVLWAMEACRRTGKCRVLVVTTASKSRTQDFQDDADEWCGVSFRTSLSSFSVISWHKLSAWVSRNWGEVSDYVYVFDEIAKASAGVSSAMGKAFLKIAGRTTDWTGFTATPGDNWLKFYPYFTACGLVKNKTCFMRDYAQVQTYKGFPEIVGWNDEDKLKEMWAIISYAPDTSQMARELPSEIHKVVPFKAPVAYSKVLRTRVSVEGDMLDTSGALTSELRRMCLTKDKQQWLGDFVENLGTGAVMFYNFIATGNLVEELLKKKLPKGAKIWRIDGLHHDIPTAETIGKHDIVLCQWQSGSEALNLQFLNYWVSIEPHYSYSTSIQARGRIKRIGQKRTMYYFYLVTDNTIEQDIMKCLKGKSDFSEDVWLAGK